MESGFENCLVRLLSSLPGCLLLLLVSLAPAGQAISADIESEMRLFEKAQEIPGLLEKGVMTDFQIPNPHWRKDACLACHTGSPETPPTALKTAADGSCYYCHTEPDHLITHPVKLRPSQRMQARMTEDFRRNLSPGAEIGCLTCHDILLQCKRRTGVMREYNRPFLRGGYYKTPSGVCYRCHDQSAYQKLNPHEQLDAQGKPEKDKCLICHRIVPAEEDIGKPGALEMQTGSDWSEMCVNCHRWVPHPGGSVSFSGEGPANHLVVPGARIRERIKKMSARNTLHISLEPGSGKIHCATCHNPHQKGVIKKPALARGADEENRLRSEKLCNICHDK
jgi:hypothetical protein